MNRKEAGFSLIELVATLSVLATLLAIALPSFTTLLQGSRASGTYHLLTTSLAAARLRAVKDNAPVTVCPSADGRTCRSDEVWRSEEHTSELQSLMRISYAVFCLKKKKTNTTKTI